MDVTHRSDDRKQEFLSTALELFYEKGYEKTTIKDIIDKMGVSKGAFYHYFESKEDVIIIIAKEYVDRAIGIMKRIIERKDLNAAQKVSEIFTSVNEYKANSESRRSRIKGVFNNEGNLKLDKKISDSIRKELNALFKKLIDDGVEEGLFETSNSTELAEFISNIIHSLNSSIDRLVIDLYEVDYEEFIRKLDEKLKFYEIMFKKILNLKGESIKFRESYLKRFSKIKN
ncbi:TetR/AcrR family transcriptional regulator [Herbivorax sp. ANBcel31]|uniref:TetR/AcrR family transcriptional regulator n=1 Tax=Herbivorax sp. ANBcel31 TaxID=3069754 RepID=UPI0027B30AC1|nr:TetR/AcrR family transcriptional regulator [Herbivorax sp. ANBcel31]MDQ2087306.1 TetR/AcrR family transcriptional regulator [Herbivorax sp. ANBcel31]